MRVSPLKYSPGNFQPNSREVQLALEPEQSTDLPKESVESLQLSDLKTCSKASKIYSEALLAAALSASVPGPLGLACATLAKELAPNDVEAWDQAERYYDEVRECSGDVKIIAQNTPYSEREINIIKAHLFYNTHILDEGPARFDADPLIANAWSRLGKGEYLAKDLQLLDHELFEARFESFFRTDYRTAHEAANRSGRESGLY